MEDAKMTNQIETDTENEIDDTVRQATDHWKDLSDQILDGDLLRAVEIDGRFQVFTYATEHCDKRGQAGISVRINACTPGGVWQEVYWTGEKAGGLVYGSPMHADDSDECLLSCITLCCHVAQHDDDENPVDPGWDAEGLWDEASMMESYLEGAE
jgi:hypothetical protein